MRTYTELGGNQPGRPKREDQKERTSREGGWLLLGGVARDQAGRSVTDERAATWANPAAVQTWTHPDRVLALPTRSGRRLDGLTIGACQLIATHQARMGDASFLAYCTARPQCYCVLSRSMSPCRLLEQHHSHRCVPYGPICKQKSGRAFSVPPYVPTYLGRHLPRRLE